MNASTIARSNVKLDTLQLVDFRNVHRGETILVCGCGESLNLVQHPERHVTIGVKDVGRRSTPDYLARYWGLLS
jgi:hypothetical protein